MGTLNDIDPARKDVWARNLTGLSGQYYGRLDVSRLADAFMYALCWLGTKFID
jgi:hypothetical protein